MKDDLYVHVTSIDEYWNLVFSINLSSVPVKFKEIWWNNILKWLKTNTFFPLSIDEIENIVWNYEIEWKTISEIQKEIIEKLNIAKEEKENNNIDDIFDLLEEWSFWNNEFSISMRRIDWIPEWAWLKLCYFFNDIDWTVVTNLWRVFYWYRKDSNLFEWIIYVNWRKKYIELNLNSWKLLWEYDIVNLSEREKTEEQILSYDWRIEHLYIKWENWFFYIENFFQKNHSDKLKIHWEDWLENYEFYLKEIYQNNVVKDSLSYVWIYWEWVDFYSIYSFNKSNWKLTFVEEIKKEQSVSFDFKKLWNKEIIISEESKKRYIVLNEFTNDKYEFEIKEDDKIFLASNWKFNCYISIWYWNIWSDYHIRKIRLISNDSNFYTKEWIKVLYEEENFDFILKSEKKTFSEFVKENKEYFYEIFDVWSNNSFKLTWSWMLEFKIIRKWDWNAKRYECSIDLSKYIK